MAKGLIIVFEGGLDEIMNGTSRSTGSVTSHIIRILVFWVVTRVIGCVSLDVSSNVFQVLGCLPFKMTATRSFETLVTTHSTTRRHSAEDLNSQPRPFTNLKSQTATYVV